VNTTRLAVLRFHQTTWARFHLWQNISNYTIPWRRNLTEKIIVAQLVKKFPVFYGTQRFITQFTWDCHWTLTWNRRIQSTVSHPISLRHILILPSHLRLGFLLYALLPRVLHAPPSHPTWCHHRNNTWRSAQVNMILIMQSSPPSHHILPLMSKYSPQHPVLKKKTFFPSH
jgi:hypothetical protein